MNINSAFPSKYLKADELEGDTVFTIDGVTVENVGTAQKAESKPVISFAETDKGLVLNKTNANTIASLYGPDTDEWNGKRVTLFATEVDFQGKQTLAIRVRMKKPMNGQAAPSSSAPARPIDAPANDQTKLLRNAALQAFREKNPGKTDEELTPAWRELLTASVPDKKPQQFSGTDWVKVKNRINAPTSPFEEEEPTMESAVELDDIPF
jgi:uncharacterized protein YcbX